MSFGADSYEICFRSAKIKNHLRNLHKIEPSDTDSLSSQLVQVGNFSRVTGNLLFWLTSFRTKIKICSIKIFWKNLQATFETLWRWEESFFHLQLFFLGWGARCCAQLQPDDEENVSQVMFYIVTMPSDEISCLDDIFCSNTTLIHLMNESSSCSEFAHSSALKIMVFIAFITLNLSFLSYTTSSFWPGGRWGQTNVWKLCWKGFLI